MTLREAVKNFEICKIIKKTVNKQGKEIEIEIDGRNGISLDIEGRIGIRDVNDSIFNPPIERLVFVIKEKELKNEER